MILVFLQALRLIDCSRYCGIYFKFDPSSPLRNAYHFHLGCLFSEIAKMRRLSKAQALSSHTNGRSFRMPEKVVFRYSGKVSERQWWPWWWGGGGGIWGQAEVLEVEMPKRPSCACLFFHDFCRLISLIQISCWTYKQKLTLLISLAQPFEFWGLWRLHFLLT